MTVLDFFPNCSQIYGGNCGEVAVAYQQTLSNCVVLNMLEAFATHFSNIFRLVILLHFRPAGSNFKKTSHLFHTRMGEHGTLNAFWRNIVGIQKSIIGKYFPTLVVEAFFSQ